MPFDCKDCLIHATWPNEEFGSQLEEASPPADLEEGLAQWGYAPLPTVLEREYCTSLFAFATKKRRSVTQNLDT